VRGYLVESEATLAGGVRLMEAICAASKEHRLHLIAEFIAFTVLPSILAALRNLLVHVRRFDPDRDHLYIEIPGRHHGRADHHRQVTG